MSNVTPPADLMAPDLYSFAQIEEAWGDVVPLPKKNFDLFRVQLGKLREFYSECSPVVNPDEAARPSLSAQAVGDVCAESREMLEILAEYHEGMDILDDLPDESDVDMAMGHFRAAHNQWLAVLARLRSSINGDTEPHASGIPASGATCVNTPQPSYQRQDNPAIPALVDAARRMVTTISMTGDMEEGCLYYNGFSAPELQAANESLTAALAKFKPAGGEL